MAAKQHGRQQSPPAGLQIGDVLAALGDFTRDVAAQDVRQLHARQPFAYPEIEMIERTSPDTYEHVVLAQFRSGHVFIPENFGTAELMDANSLHGLLQKGDARNSSKPSERSQPLHREAASESVDQSLVGGDEFTPRLGRERNV
jgi:hypothetical protein